MKEEIEVRESDHERMSRAVEKSYKDLEPFRNLNTNLILEYAGPAYGNNWTSNYSGVPSSFPGEDQGGDKLVRKLAQAVDGYMMLLVADRPSVLVTARKPQLQAFAKHFQDNLNNFLDDMGLEWISKRWVMDALFSIGVVYTQVSEGEEKEINPPVYEFGEEVVPADIVDVGEIDAINISLDNLVLDMSANDINNMQYVGHKTRIPFRQLEGGIKDGLYGDEAKKLKPTARTTSDSNRLAEISTGRSTEDYELEPMVDLAYIWTRRDQAIRTYGVDSSFHILGEAIQEEKWDGRKEGPYHTLSFNTIPENVMPSSQVANWMPLDQAINNLMRQQSRRACKLKENPVYSPDNPGVAENITDARDMQWVKSMDPKQTTVIRTGGADAGTQALIDKYEQQFDEGAGNLTSLLGLGAQSDTVGQEKLIHSAGNRIIGRMQAAYTGAMTQLVKTMAKMLWDDEYKEVDNQYTVAGYSVSSKWEPGLREGDFEDYDFVVHSMAYMGPVERVEMINRLVTQVYTPMQENMAQQGGSIDMDELSKIHADLLGIPRLRRIIKFDNQETEPSETGVGNGSRMPANTTREYIRRSSPGNPQRQAQQVTQMIPQNNNGSNGDQ